MNTNKELDKKNNHSEWTDWYLQDIGNVNGLISCRLFKLKNYLNFFKLFKCS